MNKKLNLAVIGIGKMGSHHAEQLLKLDNCCLTAVCDSSEQALKNFSEKFAVQQCYTDYRELLKNPHIDAVIIATSDAQHHDTAVAALEAQKHVLCEKPLSTDYPKAQEMVAVAQKSSKINMINFSYRNAAALHHAAQLIADGTLGRVVHISASYLQSWLLNTWGVWREEPAWLWKLSKAHGSLGALGDIGVHLLDFVSYPVGEVTELSCQLKTFSEIKGEKIGEYTLDANDLGYMQLFFANGSTADLKVSRWSGGYLNTVEMTIFGTEGALRINLDESEDHLLLCHKEDLAQTRWYRVHCPATPSMKQRFITSILTGKQDQPDFARGAEIQKMLDACVLADSQRHNICLKDL